MVLPYKGLSRGCEYCLVLHYFLSEASKSEAWGWKISTYLSNVMRQYVTLFEVKTKNKFNGVDASGGHTRSHSEHDG